MLAVLGGANLIAGAAEEPPLLQFAAKGQTAAVKSLLDRGADLEAKDRNGRTALMLAAQHGRLETVQLLIARGAKTDTRDREGNTAYMLALFSPAGHGDHDAVLQVLPRPARRPRLSLEVASSGGALFSSCFQTRERLREMIAALHLADLFLHQFAEYARTSGRTLVDFVEESPELIAKIDIQPGVTCRAQGGDDLTLNIGVRMTGARDQNTVFQKDFGGSVIGRRAETVLQTVPTTEQYAPVFEAWIKSWPGRIYWAIAAEAYRHTPQQ